MMHSTTFTSPRAQLPKLDAISIRIFELEQLLEKSRSQLQQLLTKVEQYAEDAPICWEDIQHLESIEAAIADFWGPIEHMQAVAKTAEEDEAYLEGIRLITQWHTELGHNINLYQWIKRIHDHKDFPLLNETRKKIIEEHIKVFHLSGIHLALLQKQEYEKIQMQLAQDGARFESNIVDSSREQAILISDESQLYGLSDRMVLHAKKAAEQRGQTGWLLTLDDSTLQAVMTNARERSLRQNFYEAWVTRASESTRFDNSQLMYDILLKRHQLSQLTHFNNYAERSLAGDKMAKSPEDVISFLNQLLEPAFVAAQREFTTLKSFAYQKEKIDDLHEWDLTYFSEQLSESQFGIQQETLKPYFPITHVLTELFSILHEQFGLNIERVHTATVWHPAVEVFEIKDAKDRIRGYLYLDLYARENKRSGAWVNPYRQRRLDQNQYLHLPIAFLICNFSPPVESEPSLLTHDDIVTLFHEMGHALHHVLTQVNDAAVSGMGGVPWDAVEFPSQLLEQFPWQGFLLERLSQHYKTKEKLPITVIQSLNASRHFQAGLRLIRQLEFSLFDFKLHQQFDASHGPKQIQALLDTVRLKTRVFPVSSFNRFAHSFAHVFSGGYGAGYYSYLWAEVLAADALGRFIEEGFSKGQLNLKTGYDFMTSVLEWGGAVDMLVLFERFRGRAPDSKALLSQRGLAV